VTEPEPRSLDEWRQAVEAAEAGGDHLGACDVALAGLRDFPGDSELVYLAVLNTSRAGGLKRARLLWQEHGLDGSADERIAALGARLKREVALAATGPDRQRLLSEAADEYARIYRRREATTFPGINAAVLYFLAEDLTRATPLAAEIARRCAEARPVDAGEEFNIAADRAAAELILGHQDVAARVIEAAGRLGAKATAIASTRRQLNQICAAASIDRAVLAPLANRAVVHFTGHMVAPPGEAGRFPAAEVERVAGEIGRVMDERRVGYGYGSLACGSDTLFAEALLARGGELNVVLPFGAASFRQVSVENGGPGWSERFDRCLARARVSYASDGAYGGDAELFTHCSRLAMGTAILAARRLETDLCQIAVWDGQQTAHPAGTAVDIELWRRQGGSTIVIDSRGTLRAASPGDRQPPPAGGTPARKVLAMIFGDFAGFSKLEDAQTVRFVETVMGVAGAVLDRHGASILSKNTWGDGLFVVLDSLGVAAQCALDLQSAVAGLDMAALGLPSRLGLRIGLHAGPVFEVQDPVTRLTGYAGTHISRTARIEPVTPAGEVYVTEQFAALLSLERHAGLFCDLLRHASQV
jgi:hypothetical protein